MSLIERLEKEIAKQDRKVSESLGRRHHAGYDQEAATLRELLTELRAQLHPPLLYVPPGNWLTDEVYNQLRSTGYVTYDR